MSKITFGEFLKNKRIEKGLTQKALSQMLYVSESTVSKWEKNVAHPDMSLLTQLANLLDVSEHELITASVDEDSRKDRENSKKWKSLTLSLNVFFYISYGITILTCFIVNLAVSKKLGWFFIVLSSLFLSATFTTIPQFIKRCRVLFITLSELFALILLFAVCNIYTGGSWFLLATLPTVAFYLCVFLPIIIKFTKLPNFIKRHNGVISVSVSWLAVVFTLYYINFFVGGSWFYSVALPFLSEGLLVAILTVIVLGYIKLNKILKAGIELVLWTAVYITVGYTTVPILENAGINTETSNEFHPFFVNFAKWSGDYISYNITMIIFMCLAVLSVIFTVLGIIKQIKIFKKS